MGIREWAVHSYSVCVAKRQQRRWKVTMAIAKYCNPPVMYQHDAIAKQTDWTPLSEGGSNFVAQRLRQPNVGRLEFAPTPTAYVLTFLPLTFAALQIPVVYVLLNYVFQDENQILSRTICILLAGLGILAGPIISWLLCATMLPAAVFDRSQGLFWKGRMPPNSFEVEEFSVRSCRLDNIHALQILRERVTIRSSEGTQSYNSYELNLVLKDSRRLNVVDHGGLEIVRQNAKELADFLKSPLWDATQDAD